MPVATLLPELLTEIFFHIVTDYRAESRYRLYYKWLYITHVNRHWRAVALGYGRLWSHIPLLRPECVKTFLVRSGQAPLKLTLGPEHVRIGNCTNSDIQRYIESLKATFNDLHRVTEVKIVDSIWHGCRELEALRDVPMLERFELRESPLLWGDEMSFKFKRHRLKELVLRPRRYFENSPMQTERFKAMLRALQDIPTLETLVLCDTAPNISIMEAKQQTAITLPRLRFIDIGEEIRVASLLLDKIIFPTTAAIRQSIEHGLHSWNDPETEGKYVQFANSVFSKLCGDTATGHVQPLLTLELDMGEPRITLRGWTTAQVANDTAYPVRTDHPRVSISFYGGWIHMSPTAVKILCDQLPLSTVRILSIRQLGSRSKWEVTSSWFRWARNVRMLRLSGWSVRGILDAKLFNFPEDLTRTGGGQDLMEDVSFPQLTTLTLVDDSDGVSSRQQDTERLGAMLDMRIEHGTLKSLWFLRFHKLAELYGIAT